MSHRPTYIDLGSASLNNNGSTESPRDIPSPRSGDVPPTLSPLDAFAFQGRMLARKFEENHEDGRRISRLPTLAVANEFGRHRHNYFSSTTPAQSEPTNDSNDPVQNNPETTRPDFRPKSIHPSLQTSDDNACWVRGELGLGQIHTLSPPLEAEEDDDTRASQSKPSPYTPFAPVAKELITLTSASPQGSRPQSLTELKNHQSGVSTPLDQTQPYSSTSAKTAYATASPTITAALETSKPTFLSTLAPPRSPLLQKSPRFQTGARSVRSEAEEDSDSASYLGEPSESNRRPSFATLQSSRPRSPFSPLFAPPRPPSASSDYSVLASPNIRQSVNFSRPISRAGRPSTDSRPSIESSSRHVCLESPQLRPSMDVLSIQESIDTPHLRSAPFDNGNTGDSTFPAVQPSSDAIPDHDHPAPSYIYAKYSLPRGRILSRSSMLALEQSQSANAVPWQESTTGSPAGPAYPLSNSDIMRPSSSQGTSRLTDSTRNAISMLSHGRSRSADASRSSTPPAKSGPNDTADMISGILPITTTRDHQQVGSRRDQMTPEEHLSQGILSHEEGALQKSTYHLRIAARAGLPTGMLLYALACRHGWGIRPNQAEGVAWLRKAVDSAGLEVAGDDGPAGAETSSLPKQARDYLIEKQHRAQLALSIYELGVSYLNGWGIGQDKQLAVRCFVIAGSWGDADALAEAGFCYARGVGCKKDLRKAADFYRRAEAKGIAMTGNSWIYKEKYLPPEEATEHARSRSQFRDKGKEKKPRDKSRTRTIFGGKKKPAG